MTELFLLASEYYPKDAFGTCLFQNQGTFLEGSAGGGDIINEPEGLPFEKSSFFCCDMESIFQVSETFFSGLSFHLGFSGTDTKQGISEEWDFEPRGELR